MNAIDEMWAAMSESQKQENQKKYGELTKNARISKTESNTANHILDWTVSSIEECVSLAYPWTIYVPCLISMRFFLYLIKSVPTSWATFVITQVRKRV